MIAHPSENKPVSRDSRPRVLILGSGIAGLSAAIKFVEKARAVGRQIHVTLVAKLDLAEGSTRYAQGGIASVWSKDDSFEKHITDTLTAGAGLCRDSIVNLCVREGPARIRELMDWGVEFTKNENARTLKDPTEEFDLHREGGHQARRILHADDLTGWAIEKALIAQIRRMPEVTLLESHAAIDLITEGNLLRRFRKPGRCLGAYVLDSQSGRVLALASDVTVLATGGAGKVYLYTSNPDTVTGDGIAMSYRAGARVANMEFMQFHPTCLYHPGARTFLISEALRGEGAVLKNTLGEEFMKRYHPLGSLAPRDIVARAIDSEIKRLGAQHVWLDCTLLPAEETRKKFPNIFETCLKYGIDITKHPIPVVPACHYTCGGVQVDENAKTSIEGLYAVGEVACTGLHGANRLASNSLLEAVVFSHRAVENALPFLLSLNAEEVKKTSESARESGSQEMLPDWDPGQAVPVEEQIDIAANWLEIRTLMWNYVGIVRNDRRLERARKRIETLKNEVHSYYWNHLLTKDLIELRNLVQVAEIIVQSAIMRKESRGLHYTSDYPERDDLHFSRDTVL